MLKKFKSGARKLMSGGKKRSSGERNLRRLVMCKKCHTFYYKNSWHFDTPVNLELDSDKEVPVLFTDCVACLEEESALYETESNFILGRA